MSSSLTQGTCSVLRLALHRKCKNNKQRAEYLRQALLFCFGISVGRIECINNFSAPPKSRPAKYCYYWQEGHKRLLLDVIHPKIDTKLWSELDRIAANIYQVFAEDYYPHNRQVDSYLEQSVNAAKKVLTPSILKIAWSARRFNLTHRQAESLCYVVNGFSVKEASFKLGIKLSTIKSHLNAAYKILQVNNVNEARLKVNHRAVQWIR
jgi:DNA-binding CsgD family transcriptional regulator